MSEFKFMGVSLSINDKHFVLVQDPAISGKECCDQCALSGEPFCVSGKLSLLSLCCFDDSNGNAYFKEVESWSDLSQKE